jgi:hypothetical protein
MSWPTIACTARSVLPTLLKVVAPPFFSSSNFLSFSTFLVVQMSPCGHADFCHECASQCTQWFVPV